MSFLKRTFNWLPFLAVFLILQTSVITMYFIDTQQNVADLLSIVSMVFACWFIGQKNCTKSGPKASLTFEFRLYYFYNPLEFVSTICFIFLLGTHTQHSEWWWFIVIAVAVLCLILLIVEKYKKRVDTNIFLPQFLWSKYSVIGLSTIMLAINCILTCAFFGQESFNFAKKIIWLLNLAGICTNFLGKDQLRWLRKV